MTLTTWWNIIQTVHHGDMCNCQWLADVHVLTKFTHNRCIFKLSNSPLFDITTYTQTQTHVTQFFASIKENMLFLKKDYLGLQAIE